ncbi:MAG: Tol-Pal system peptidoglycan-associated lipoprotein PAL [Nitrospira sp.]|nr:MAG: Tol-Pal system peptidoglycan-associated lipoprotein PAL [Nitrospira sp.]
MLLQRRRGRDRLVLWVMVLTIVAGCSGRRVMSGVEDQASVSRPFPEDEAAKVAPPARVEAPEMRLPEQPAAVESPSNPIPPPSEPVAELADVYFDFDQYALRREARSRLKAAATILQAQPDQTIVIEGHCDERGTSAYNLVLGERRAQAAKRYLQDLGVAASQLRILSYGKERPFCTEHSEACWQSNRRVHFKQP